MNFFKMVGVLGCLAWASQSYAGFLEMPETSEVPELQQETLLKDLDIPNVRERDPDPESGPRLNVTKFRIQGVVEYPELGITREKLNKLVENIRFDLMEEGELLDSGYSLEEISELSDLVAEIEEQTGDEHVGPLEVQRLVFFIREQRRNRGVTLGNIETVADTITRYYRERGFILAKAYIPKQQVRDGVVTLTLLLGELGEVAVKKNKIYGERLIQRVLKGNMNKPVTSDTMQERIYLINDFPGLSAQGYFEPGSQVGDTRLNINVTGEERFASNIRLDNHGTSSTGEIRTYLDLQVNNPTGLGDRLHVAILNTFDPDNSTYGSIRYGIPLMSPRFEFTAGYSRNAFIPSELESNDGTEALEATSNALDSTLKYKLSRSREKNTALSLRVADIRTTTTEDDGDEDSTQMVELTYSFDVLQQKSSTLHQGAFTLVGSKFDNPDPSKQTKPTEDQVGAKDETTVEAAYVKFDYSMLKFIELPFFKKKARWLTQVGGQYAGILMSSTNQFGITGPSRARSFSVEDYFADDGFFLRTDLIFQPPKFLDFNLGGEKLSRIMQPSIFMDAAYGTIYNFENAKDGGIAGEEVYARATLVDIGFGLTFSYKGKIRSNITFATPIVFDPDVQVDTSQALTESDLESLPLAGADGPKLFMDLQYSF